MSSDLERLAALKGLGKRMTGEAEPRLVMPRIDRLLLAIYLFSRLSGPVN